MKCFVIRGAEEMAAYLILGVACVPEGIAEVLSCASGGVDHLERHPRDAKGLVRLVLPVGLCDLLPHDHVEAPA